MPQYQGESHYRHGSGECTGVLVCNLGTPQAPTPAALRRYLRQFLGDPRVVEAPRWIWWWVLNGVILNTRPRKSAAMYQRIWTEAGSPLLEIAKAQVDNLQRSLDERFQGPVKAVLGMTYGQPSIGAALAALRDAGARRVLVLPLYPQYSGATTASVFDAVTRELQTWRWIPEMRFINHYHDHPGYIDALATQARVEWRAFGPPDRLLYSFHGIPKAYQRAGDPYYCQCLKTARLVSERLALTDDQWTVAFQSRVGPKEWLKPYTDKRLQQLGKQRLGTLHVMCPGFAADCLETLDEIANENRELFIKAGGGQFRYIPALNATPEHIAALSDLVAQHTQGWPETDAGYCAATVQAACRQSAQRAHAQSKIMS